MLTDAEIDGLLAVEGNIPDPQNALKAVLDKVECCRFCFELFPSARDLTDHLLGRHLDDMPSAGKRSVDEHQVEAGTEKIYICSFCGYAVSKEGFISPTSRIDDHVDHCPEYKKVASLRHKSCRYSSDPDLIRAYVTGEAEIEWFECQHCGYTFGSQAGLALHLAAEESNATPEEVKGEQLGQIVSRAQRQIASSEQTDALAGTDSLATIIGVSKTYKRGTGRPTQRAARTPSERVPARKSKKRSTPASLINLEFSRTVSEKEISGGYCDLPPRLHRGIGQTESMGVRFREDADEELRYHSKSGTLFGLGSWYLGNAIEPGDKILFRLLEMGPPKISLWTKWQRSVDYILECPPEDFEWDHMSIRDCLVRVLAGFAEPIHYRTLYAEISKHRQLAPASIIAALSLYRGTLFQLTQRGKWELLRDGVTSAEMGSRPAVYLSAQEADDRLNEDWLKTVAAHVAGHIEENDLVYRLLCRYHEDMSFNQICQWLADYYSVDWHALSATGFFNASARDPRLKRLPNGRFVLKEWREAPEEVVPATRVPAPAPPAEIAEPAPPPEPSNAPNVPPYHEDAGDTESERKPEGIGRKLWSLIQRIVAVFLCRIARNRGSDGKRT